MTPVTNLDSTIDDSTELLQSIDIKDKFDYVYLDCICFEHLNETLTTKHYPLDSTLSLKGLSVEDRNKVLDSKIGLIRRLHKISLRENMLEWIKLNPNKRGTVYFSPASTLATINNEAKVVYVFGVGAIEDDEMQIQSESNYLIV